MKTLSGKPDTLRRRAGRLPLLLAAVVMAGLAGAARAAEVPDLRFQVRDFAVGKDAVALSARREARGQGAFYRVEAGGLGLDVSAEAEVSRDRVAVDCSVRDRRGEDRALTVRIGLPLDAVGWQWHDDPATARTIEAGKSYEKVQSWGGLRSVSVYPFCALAGAGRGVGMAVDLDDPRVYRFRYDAAAKTLWIEVDLGIARDAGPIAGAANFSFLLFDFPPAWGFRAALQRYYALFPEFARRRAPDDGIWLLSFSPGAMANPWDFGLKFDEGGQGRAGYDVTHGIEPYVYTEPWGKYEHFGDRPTPDGKPRYGEKAPLLPVPQMMEILRGDLSLPDKVRDRHFGGAPRSEIARSLENSAITDREGRWVLRHWTDEWSKGDWLSNVTCNPDPKLPRPNRASVAWERELWPAFRVAERAGGALKGIYHDSIASFMGFDNENFRRDHWRVADIPLVPSEAAKGPAQLHAFACVPFARQVAEEMWGRNLLVIANTFRPHMQYFTHLVDMIGAGETKSCGLMPDEHYRYLRAYAGTKPVSWMDYSFVDPKVSWEQKERGMNRCLFYAVHPGTGPFDAADQFEPSRPLFRRYERLIIALGQAGWQPVTDAWVRRTAEGAAGGAGRAGRAGGAGRVGGASQGSQAGGAGQGSRGSQTGQTGPTGAGAPDPTGAAGAAPDPAGAGAEPPPLLVERFGAAEDSVWFTLRNPNAGEQSGELVADLPAGLAAAKDVMVWDALAERPAAGARVSRRPATAVVPFTLAPEETAVYRVATRDRILRDALVETRTWLERFRAEAQWVGRATGGVLVNGGFEDEMAPWGTDEKAGRQTTVTISKEEPLAGKSSLRVVSEGADANAAIHQGADLRGGVPYHFSFTYRWSRPEGARGGVVPRFGVKDAAGQWLSKDYVHVNDLQPTGGKPAHFEREVTFVPATAGGFFQFLCSGAFGTFEVDEVMLRPAATQTPRESVEKSLAALTASGAEQHLQAALAAGGKPDQVDRLAAVVNAFLAVAQGVDAATSGEHVRRCLGLPLQAAALSASRALEIAARVHVQATEFQPATAGESVRVPLALTNLSRSGVAGWKVRVLGQEGPAVEAGPVPAWSPKVTGDGSLRGSADAQVVVPIECRWGWHDVLLKAEVGWGKQTLPLLRRVTLRLQPAASVTVVSPALAGDERTLRLSLENHSGRDLAGRLRVEGQGIAPVEVDAAVPAGGRQVVPVRVEAAGVPAAGARVKASWQAGAHTATWEGEVFPVPAASCPRVAQAPAVDGNLDDPAWQVAGALSPFVLHGAPAAPKQQTDIRLCRDDQNLYVAITCHGPTGALAAAHTGRDGDLWMDDAVELFLDPDGRREEYFHLVVNAAGARYDAVRAGGALDKGWNGEWEARVARQPDAWRVEMAIPFAALRARPVGAWSANFARADAGAGEASVWACTHGGFHTPARFGELRF